MIAQRRATQVAHFAGSRHRPPLIIVITCRPAASRLPPWKGRTAFLVAGAPPDRCREQNTADAGGGDRPTARVVAQIHHCLLGRISWPRALRSRRCGRRQNALHCRGQGALSEPARRQRLTATASSPISSSCAVVAAACRSGRPPTMASSGNDPITGADTPPINAHLIHMHIGVDAPGRAGRARLAPHGDQDPCARAQSRSLAPRPAASTRPSQSDPDTGAPSGDRISTPRRLLLEERMLQSACYIVCAYLTGMRDCEVQAMRAGCLNVRRSEDGLIERYQIRSAVYKRRDVRGQAENWITIEPVAKAIAVLERLTQHLRRAARSSTMAEVERVSDIDCRPRAFGQSGCAFL